MKYTKLSVAVMALLYSSATGVQAVKLNKFTDS